MEQICPTLSRYGMHDNFQRQAGNFPNETAKARIGPDKQSWLGGTLGLITLHPVSPLPRSTALAHSGSSQCHASLLLIPNQSRTRLKTVCTRFLPLLWTCSNFISYCCCYHRANGRRFWPTVEVRNLQCTCIQLARVARLPSRQCGGCSSKGIRSSAPSSERRLK